jgi:hypothetical protein
VSYRFLALSAALAATASLFAVPGPAFADGVIDPSPIGPHQFFIGVVNGQSGTATIRMACFGPTRPGRTGHPLAGQTVAARQVVTTTGFKVGYTGDTGRGLRVAFDDLSTVDSPVLLRGYGVAAKIPTTLTLPCDGTGTVSFMPVPTDPTARAATVSVSYLSQP